MTSVVQPGLGNVDERGDVAAQVQQRVQLHPGLGGAEQGPGKHGQAQVDGGGVERVDGVVEFQPEVLPGVQRARDADQRLGEVRVDAPVPLPVRVGQRVAGDAAADPHVLELPAMGTEADLDVAQALAVGQLRERQAQELVQAGERLDAAVSPITLHAPAKDLQGQMFHELRKHESPGMHGPPPPTEKPPR